MVMTSMIKLIAIDIDSTMTEIDGTIRQITLDSIRQARSKGILIALISARPPQGIDTVVDLLGIDVYRVSYLGAVIQTPSLVELQRLELDLEVARDIARFADAHGIALTLNIGDVEYQTHNMARPSMTSSTVVHLAERVLESGYSPVIIAVDGHESSKLIYDYCLETYPRQVHVVRHVNSGGVNNSTLVVHPDAQKGKSLTKLCRLLGIPSNGVMAIGDSESDTTMFEVAGISVAVRNADLLASNVAQIVSPLPFGAGVKWAIENYALLT